MVINYKLKRFHEWLHEPVLGTPLWSFRVLFGSLMLFSTARFMALGWINDHFIQPKFHFRYFGWEWISVAPPEIMIAIHWLMLLASIGILLGIAYRISAILFFVLFTYTHLIDVTHYLNHYYAVSLLSFWLIWVPAERGFSWVSRKKFDCGIEETVPRWTIGIFRFQLALIYFYAGLAKIQPAWLLEAMPLRIWLPAKTDLWLIGKLFEFSWIPWVMSWAGMLYDTLIPFALFNNKTRPWAMIVVILFHSVTGALFQIGIFPIIMTGSVLIFFSAQWHQRLQRFFLPKEHTLSSNNPIVGRQPFASIWLTWFIIGYALFQIFFPWRFLLYEGNLFWTENGYRWGWRVMLME
ncbi:MAG: HTTM domain-containing protein, partial [Bacteroidia bacterium]|nr:HTTM domain-containing protein [Bacteroidia bacterium]